MQAPDYIFNSFSSDIVNLLKYKRQSYIFFSSPTPSPSKKDKCAEFITMATVTFIW